MSPYTIENLYSEFRSTFVDEPDFMIAFYEKNAIFLNNIKQFEDKEELRLFVLMIGRYIEAVYKKCSCNSAINLVNKYQDFIDKEIQRLNAEGIKNEWYYQLKVVKGMASYDLKDYKTAVQIFKKLLLIDNQNENYKNWLNSSQYGQRLWLIRIITIASILLFLVGIFFKKSIPLNNRIPLDGIGLLGFLFIVIYDHYAKRSFRRNKN